MHFKDLAPPSPVSFSIIFFALYETDDFLFYVLYIPATTWS